MSKVFIPSVILSNSLDKIKSIVNRKSEIIDFDNFIEEPGIFFLTPKNNKYLTHFEFSLGFPDSNATKLTIKFIDSDNNFQKLFFTNKVLEDMLAHIVDNSRNYFGNDTTKQEELLAQEQKIYFCFGIGTETKNWSGIYTGVIINANLNIQNTIREYIFDVFPSNCYLFRSKIGPDANNAGNPYKYAYLGGANIKTVGRYKIQEKERNVILYEHGEVAQKIMYNVFKDYIHNVSLNKNILIFLPDISKQFDELHQKTVKEDESFFDNLNTTHTNVFAKLLNEKFGIKLVDLSKSSKYEDLFREVKLANLREIGIGYTDVKVDIKNSWYEYNSKSEDLGALLTVESKDTGSSESPINKVEPNIPNWRAPFDILELGIKNLINGLAGTIICFEENNTELLKIWKEAGLIENDKEPCVIFGFDQMIFDYLYVNQTTALNEAIYYKSKYSFWKKDPLINKFDNKGYREKVYELLYNNRSNSCFGEDVNIDELANSISDPRSSILLDGIAIAKKFDVPLFTYNFFNSNVLELEIDMNQNYWTSVLAAVRDNRSRYFANAVYQNYDTIVRSLGESIDRHVIRAKIEDIQKELSKLDQESKKALGEKFQKVELDLINTSINPELQKLKPYVSILNQDSITKLHAMVASKLMDSVGEGKTFSKVNPEALFSLASFIIGTNKLKDPGGNSEVQTSLIPSINGPSSESIQGDIFKYMMDNFLTLKLRTLPYFHLSGWNVVSMPAFVFGKRTNFIDPTNSNPANFEKANQNEFYNGLYTILGFKHTITTKEAYSEFKLARNTLSLDDASTLNNKTIEPTEEQKTALNEDLNYNLRESNKLAKSLGLSTYSLMYDNVNTKIFGPRVYKD
jgi:hypothetical protein